MASTAPAPSSQQSGDRPISFVLVDNNDPANAISPQQALTLYIRPEDISRSDTSRISPQQTLGGQVWADNFGPGMPTINISGHTGWRPPADASKGTDDGAARFLKLKNQVFTSWHSRRQVAIQNGKDPDATVQLQFADQLDAFAAVVAPLNFVLRRSRSRPLLMQYQINMIVLSDEIAQPGASGLAGALTAAQRRAAGITSLVASINDITAQINSVKNYVDGSIAVPIAQFMRQTATVFTAIQNGINSVQGVTNSLIAVGRLAAQCGVNIFRSLAAIAGLPQFFKANIMEIAGAFSNVLCVLHNVFTQQLLYPAYDPLYGSSNCSSTSGGRPPSALAGLNPFEYTHPSMPADSITASTSAQAAMKSMGSTDVVLTPPTVAQIGATASTVAGGLVGTA